VKKGEKKKQKLLVITLCKGLGREKQVEEHGSSTLKNLLKKKAMGKKGWTGPSRLATSNKEERNCLTNMGGKDMNKKKKKRGGEGQKSIAYSVRVSGLCAGRRKKRGEAE